MAPASDVHCEKKRNVMLPLERHKTSLKTVSIRNLPDLLAYHLTKNVFISRSGPLHNHPYNASSYTGIMTSLALSQLIPRNLLLVNGNILALKPPLSFPSTGAGEET